MEFVEAIEKAKKMCTAYKYCEDCALREGQYGSCQINDILGCDDVREVEKIISEWKSVVDWSKVAVDTPIIVWDEDKNKSRKRYFAKYEDGEVYAWSNGCTSWNAIGLVTEWDNAELAEGVKNND